MTVRTNTVRIDVDTNPDFPHPINTDLMREIAAECIDWRILVWDPDQDDDDGVLAEIYENVWQKLTNNYVGINLACNVSDPETRPIVKRDTVDALDFIWVIEYETAYEGTVSTYTDAVMISYTITHLNDGMNDSESVEV